MYSVARIFLAGVMIASAPVLSVSVIGLSGTAALAQTKTSLEQVKDLLKDAKDNDGLKSSISKFLTDNPSAYQAVIDAAPDAAAGQKSTLGSALGDFAKSVVTSNPTLANSIIGAMNSVTGDMKTSFSLASGNVQTAGTGGTGGGAGGGGGGSGGGSTGGGVSGSSVTNSGSTGSTARTGTNTNSGNTILTSSTTSTSTSGLSACSSASATNCIR
jgi:hypothetical protein